MTATTPLGITLLFESAVKGHVTASEAIVMLAWAAGGSRLVNTTATNTPPGSPQDADAYLVGTSPTGAWANQANRIAVYSGYSAGWFFYAPLAGQVFYDRATEESVGWHATYGFYPLQDRWSTTEHWTGRFQGGSGSANRVYRKLISIGAMPNATTKDVAHSISSMDLDAPMLVRGSYGTTTTGRPMPEVNSAGSVIDVYVDATEVHVYSNVNLSTYTGWVFLEYRKTS